MGSGPSKPYTPPKEKRNRVAKEVLICVILIKAFKMLILYIKVRHTLLETT
jgi:hypothetical protein